MNPLRLLYAGALYVGELFAGALFRDQDTPDIPADPAPGGAWVAYDPGAAWVSPEPGRDCRALDPGTVWVIPPMSATAPPLLRKKAAASRSYRVDLTQWAELRAGQTLSGTPTVTVSPAGPTVSGAAIDTDNVKRIKFRVAGGTAGVEYTLTFSVGTSGGDTLAGDVTLVVD